LSIVNGLAFEESNTDAKKVRATPQSGACKSCILVWNNLRSQIGCNNQTNSICQTIQKLFGISAKTCQNAINSICKKGCESDPTKCSVVACTLIGLCNNKTKTDELIEDPSMHSQRGLRNGHKAHSRLHVQNQNNPEEQHSKRLTVKTESVEKLIATSIVKAHESRKNIRIVPQSVGCKSCVTFWTQLRSQVGCNNQTNTICQTIQRLFGISALTCQNAINSICRQGCASDPSKCALVACTLIGFCSNKTQVYGPQSQNYEDLIQQLEHEQHSRPLMAKTESAERIVDSNEKINGPKKISTIYQNENSRSFRQIDSGATGGVTRNGAKILPLVEGDIKVPETVKTLEAPASVFETIKHNAKLFWDGICAIAAKIGNFFSHLF